MDTLEAPTPAERVAAGAAYLDGVMPGWANKIDLATLHLQSGCLCVLGQLAHDIETSINPECERWWDFLDWVDGLVSGVPEIGLDLANDYGFTIKDHAEGITFAALEAEWRTLISERQA